jgi:MerR family transcriptional regulator, light-induced transcriptional regulator
MANSNPLSTPQFPIRLVVRRTGLSASVLRAWERRYGAVVPERSEGGQRLYSESDVRKLILLKDLVEVGHTIGQVATQEEDELRSLLLRERGISEEGGTSLGSNGSNGRSSPAHRSGRRGEGPAMGPGAAPAGESDRERSPRIPVSALGLDDDEDPVAGFLSASIQAVHDMDTRRLEELLNRASVALTPTDLTGRLMIPFLNRIGLLWERGEVGPASEHVASGVVRRFLDGLLDRLDSQAGAALVLTGTPAGQRHEFGALLAGIVAAAEGWRVIPLGPDLPASEIAEAARRKGAQSVALSALQPLEGDDVRRELLLLRKELPGEVHVLVGGPGARPFRDELIRAGVVFLEDLQELRDRLRARRRAAEEALDGV